MRPWPLFVVLAMLVTVLNPLRADVTLAAPFSNHMVLQREFPVEIWGTAEAGEQVTVRFDDQTASGVADAKGKWRVTLKPLKADGKGQPLTIVGKNTVTLDDVLVGEVWLGTGQSNMAAGAGKAGEAARQPQIRLLGEDNVWTICTPEAVEKFSAVLFHFATRIHTELKVPVGLINRSRGSKAIEVFLPPPANGMLYKQLIEPLQPMSIRGVLWYQGEANRSDGLAYAAKQQALVEGWRKAWGREFSFYAVQIAPFTGYGDKYDIPSLWEAQVAILKMPRTGIAIINDTAGTMTNIHPGNKDKVGQRLANWALAKDYGRRDIQFSSPLFKAITIEDSNIRLFFAHAKGLKTSDGKPPGEFEIAGADGKYVPATATIDGETVVVHADAVAKPVKVRHAWRNTPKVTLVNGEGLPATAFHTDDWRGGTSD